VPAFTGLLVHHDTRFGFVVLVPDGWHRLSLTSNSTGAFYAPDDDDLLTGLAIDAVDLGTRVKRGDLSALRSGFLAGLRSLSDAHIEFHESSAVGDLVSLEARVTFRDGDAIRARWVRLLYQGTTQLRLVAQAASVDLFHSWEPMFFEAMRTVRFGLAY